jgi:hypothetical protein
MGRCAGRSKMYVARPPPTSRGCDRGQYLRGACRGDKTDWQKDGHISETLQRRTLARDFIFVLAIVVLTLAAKHFEAAKMMMPRNSDSTYVLALDPAGDWHAACLVSVIGVHTKCSRNEDADNQRVSVRVLARAKMPKNK